MWLIQGAAFSLASMGRMDCTGRSAHHNVVKPNRGLSSPARLPNTTSGTYRLNIFSRTLLDQLHLPHESSARGLEDVQIGAAGQITSVQHYFVPTDVHVAYVH